MGSVQTNLEQRLLFFGRTIAGDQIILFLCKVLKGESLAQMTPFNRSALADSCNIDPNSSLTELGHKEGKDGEMEVEPDYSGRVKIWQIRKAITDVELNDDIINGALANKGTTLAMNLNFLMSLTTISYFSFAASDSVSTCFRNMCVGLFGYFLKHCYR